MCMVTFLRHAETNLNNDNLFCGRTDCDITLNGSNSASQLKKTKLFSEGFDTIYVSPLKRTHQTLLSIYPNTNYQIDERINEISLGSWEGISKLEVDQSLRKQFRLGTYTPPGAETHDEVVQRLTSFINDIDKTNYNKVLVVTHAGILRTLKQLYFPLLPENTKNLDFITFDSKDIK